MASYRVFEFPGALPTRKAAGEDVRFVRDGFSFAALVFPSIWLLWHRLWMSFAFFVLLMASFIFVADTISPVLGVFLNALVGFYLGFEGTNLKSVKLKNAGWHEVDVIVASDEEEAEVRYFSNRLRTVSSDEVNAAPVTTATAQRFIKPFSSPSKNRQIIGGFPSSPAGSRS